jgi:tetratricopeptide (TPR) repeat protein
MNLDNLSTSSFIFPEFKEIEKRKQDRKLGPYTEISLEIFEKLGCQDLCQASLVCKEWKLLVEQTHLWKELYPASFKVGSQEEEQPGDKVQFSDLSSCHWNKAHIATSLWQDSTTIISDSIEVKVKAAAAYLKEEGFELKGVASDGDCFFSSFLGSYACLSRKIPLLDEYKDKISYLRQVLADIVKHTDSKRAEEIRRKAAWVSGLGEGDLLALALSIPIRLVTINEEKLVCGIHDRLIFSIQGLSEENRSQEWKMLSPEQQPTEYILIVDLGGHFVYAQPLKRERSLFLDSKSFSNVFLSNSLPINALKSPLETSGSKKLLSDEQIKEVEEAYTQALKRAVEEKDLIQESLCIERLGDIYLRKEMSETLLQAAGLYNYALRLAPQERQEIIKTRLFQVQNLLVKQCNGKPFDSKVMKKQFDSNRSTLKNFREEIEKKIQILPENPSCQEVRELYAEIAYQMKIFFGQLTLQALHQLDTEPCEYAMIGFGSLAREEMTPYSDLEFGILIQQDTPVNRKYFRNLTNLLHLKVINLGETILPALNIPCLKAINFFDGVTPRGFAFDGAGVEEKGCKTPLGNGKNFELIQTPEKMAQYIAKDEKEQWWHKKEPHLPMELLNFTHLLGSEELTEQYRQYVHSTLNTSYRGSLDLRQYLAKQHLVVADMIAFNPGMGDVDRHGMLFKVKNDFYRFPHLALDRLALLKEVAASDTFTRITQLKDKGILIDNAAEKLSEWMSIALFMRLKTYFHYQAQQETMNPLLKPFGFEDTDLIEKHFALGEDSLEKIKKIYRIFIPFYQAIDEFLMGNEETLRSSDLDDNSINTQGEIALRLFQYKEAEERYSLAIKANPQNSHVLCILGAIYKKQGNLDKAAEYSEKALAIDLKFFGENPRNVARDYNNLGQIYQEQGILGKAAECYQKALAINLKLFGKNHPTVATDYRNLGRKHREQGDLKQAVKYSKKARAIDLKFFGENHPKMARNYSNLGAIYEGRGKLGKADEYSRKALAINLKLYGEIHPTVVVHYNNLGQIYQAQGDLGKAAEYSKKALDIDLKVFGEIHPTVATDYNNLGRIYQAQRYLNKAAEYSNKALTIDLKLYGEDNSTVARDYNSLGQAYQAQGNLDKAAEFSNNAFAINLKLYGENHPDVAINYSNLGQIYREQGELEKAAEHINKALDIELKLYGENHPSVASYYNTLGQIYREQGELKKAAEHINKALDIELKLYGENHSSVAICYSNLGGIYRDQGNLDKAAEHINKALDIELKLFSENHLRMVILYGTLGQIYKAQGNLDKAAEYSNKALTIDLKLYDENNFTLARDYNNLGQAYQAQGNLDKAAECSRKALAINLKLYGENHPSVASYYNNLGQIYKEQGNLDKAAEHINKALDIELKLYGENHPRVVIRYSTLGQIYKDQGNLGKAAECSRKALAIDRKLFSENHPTVAIDYSNLRQIYQAQGNLGKAEKCSRKALAINLKLFSENHPWVAEDYNNLGQIYKDRGKLDMAADYSNKALAINLKLFGENHPRVAKSYRNLGQIYHAQSDLDKAAEYSNKALTCNR